MSFLPRPLADWFRGIRQRFFMAAVRVTVEEAVADLEAESIDIKKRRLTEAFEAFDFANGLPTGQDDYKKAAVKAFQDDLLDVSNLKNQILNGRIPFDEGREALQALPRGVGKLKLELARRVGACRPAGLAQRQRSQRPGGRPQRPDDTELRKLLAQLAGLEAPETPPRASEKVPAARGQQAVGRDVERGPERGPRVVRVAVVPPEPPHAGGGGLPLRAGLLAAAKAAAVSVVPVGGFYLATKGRMAGPLAPVFLSVPAGFVVAITAYRVAEELFFPPSRPPRMTGPVASSPRPRPPSVSAR